MTSKPDSRFPSRPRSIASKASAASSEGRAQKAAAWVTGFGCNLRQARVTTPSVPSLAIKSWLRS